MSKILEYKIEEDRLILTGDLPNKAGKLWIEYDAKLGKALTNKIYTNFIVGQSEYTLPKSPSTKEKRIVQVIYKDE